MADPTSTAGKAPPTALPRGGLRRGLRPFPLSSNSHSPSTLAQNGVDQLASGLAIWTTRGSATRTPSTSVQNSISADRHAASNAAE